MNPNIIEGYKGVMSLDLTGTDPKYRKIIIEQHYKDIELYKIEESTLPNHLRYENTVERALNVITRDQIINKLAQDEIRTKQIEKQCIYSSRKQ
jgi:hypothetical protein